MSAAVANLMLALDLLRSFGDEQPAVKVSTMNLKPEILLTCTPVLVEGNTGQEVREHAGKIREENKREDRPPNIHVLGDANHHIPEEDQK